MKKHMTRNMILMLVLDVVLGIVLALYIANTGTVPAADNADTYTDGTYTASAQGCLSEVGVTVTITGGKVTNVVIDASGETPELGDKAAETLLGLPAGGWLDRRSGCCLRQHHDQRRGICGNERLPCTGRTVMKF